MNSSLTTVDILLVEDNPNDVEITKRSFEKGRIKNVLHVARDGQEALDFLFGPNGASADVGLILLDLNIPRVSGFDVLKKVKADPKTRRIPVIIMTSSTREQDVFRGYDLGVNTFITKPVEFDDFIQVVATIKEYWLLIASLSSRNGTKA